MEITLMLILITLVLTAFFFALLAAATKLEQHDIDIAKVMEELNRHNFFM